MKIKSIFPTSFMSLVIAFVALPASAQNLVSSHGDWNVFQDSGVCYMASTPIKEDGNWNKRGQPYVLLNFKPGQIDEINVSSGYPYKKDVDVELKIDSNRKYRLFTQGEHAWAKDSSADRSILKAMQAGSKLVIKGISRKGTYSIDTYSLKGVTAAYKKLQRICK